MATDPSLALQKAFVAAIKALNTAAGNNVFDMPPVSDPFPRVTIGPANVNPILADCYDGSESFTQIDAWSRKPGYPEVKGIADAIRGALHDGTLTLDGHTLELMYVDAVVYERDPDGLTSRARLTVRTQTQPST